MIGSVVERQVVSGLDAAFAHWLVGQVREAGMVAAPDGECEALGFGSVVPVRGVEMSWGRFAGDPVRVLRRLLWRLEAGWTPVVVVERVGGSVWLSAGRLRPSGTAGGIELG